MGNSQEITFFACRLILEKPKILSLLGWKIQNIISDYLIANLKAKNRKIADGVESKKLQEKK